MSVVGDVTVVTGPPGAGKSTVAEHLVRRSSPSALVAGDDFFGFLRSGAVAPWLEAAHEQNTVVTEAAAAATGRLSARFDVVYDGVLGPWFLTPFMSAAGLSHLHYVVLLPPLSACLERVRTREGHGFTDREATQGMWNAFDRSTVDRRHVLSDHDIAPAAMADLIAQRVDDGSLRHP
jgi:cytidylate kinase